MKYGIIVSGKVTEPTDIPASGQADPLAWLAKHRWPASWVQVSADAVPGAAYNGNGSSTNPPLPPPSPPKTQKLSWEEFRKLFTEAELEALDSYDMTGCAVVLNDAQKIKLRAFMKRGEARGADSLIDVTTPGMANAIDYLVARGFVSAVGDTRKNEIIAGTVKS